MESGPQLILSGLLAFCGRNAWMGYTAGCDRGFPMRLHFVFSLISSPSERPSLQHEHEAGNQMTCLLAAAAWTHM